MKTYDKTILVKDLKCLERDLKRMSREDDYDIFMDWEIGEMEYVVKQAILELEK